jgi:prepilin-type N-terminal cleavage/methylation domain-containing protein
MRHETINLARWPWGGRAGRCAGLTLTELLIVIVILGILGAMVLPKFSDASTTTRELTLKDDLLYLRTQIIVFKAQHADTAPGYPNGKTTASPTEQDFILQMTRHTDEFCNFVNPTTANRLGPYLKKMPVNPLNGMNTILIVPNGSSMPPKGQPDNSTGWIYKPQTLEIIPNTTGNDSEGTPYVEY